MLFTERLLLRRPTMEDAPAHFAIHSDPATNVHNPSGPLALRSESDEIVEEWIEQWEHAGLGYWAVCLRSEAKRVIGFGGVSDKSLANATRSNLYFRFSPDVWGRGLATELGRSALDYALTAAGRSQVFARVRPDNAPSIAVIRKLGMALFGEVDDVPGARPSLLFATAGQPTESVIVSPTRAQLLEPIHENVVEDYAAAIRRGQISVASCPANLPVCGVTPPCWWFRRPQRPL